MNAELTTRAIMHLEPALRVRGQAIDWDKFNEQLDQGLYNDFLGDDQDKIAAAIANYTES